MEPARPLHSVFADLAGGRGYGASSGMTPEEVLAANGHPDLPDGLVAEAVVTYADTAPVEVAEHLAPYVRAHTAVPQPGGGSGEPEPHWYDLLTTAPVAPDGGPDVIDAEASRLAEQADAVGGGDAPTADIDDDVIDSGDPGSGDAEPGGFGSGAVASGPFGHSQPDASEEAIGPVDDVALSWSTDAGLDPAGLDTDAGIDLGPIAEGRDSGPAAGDEPDAVDGG
jgi:hypothetical protein